MTAMLNTVRQTGQLTILLRDDLDVPAVIDRETNTIYVNATQTDEDIAYFVDQAVRTLLRPTLRNVSTDAPPASVEEVVVPRPKLRLVRAGGDR